MDAPAHDSKRQYAVVTGASSGIGLAVACELASRGWGTFLLARRGHLLDALAQELSLHAPSVPLVVDLADPNAAEEVATRILSTHGAVDAIVNNAGFGLYGSFLSHDLAEHRRLMQVNYFSPLSLIRAFLPSMLALGRGCVVNVASMSAKMGPWGHSGYSASKAALRSLTETLEAEFGPKGVRFSCVFPGIVDTPYFEKGGMRKLFSMLRNRAISAPRCASAVCNALDRPRIWICVPWHYRFLDAMCALSPRVAHRVVAASSRAPE